MVFESADGALLILQLGAVTKAGKERPGSFLDLVGQAFGQRGGLERAVFLAGGTGSGDLPARHFVSTRTVDAIEPELVSQTALTFALNQQVNQDFLLETQGRQVITLGVNPGEAYLKAIAREDGGITNRTQKSVLGSFHEAEEVREMHDAFHIGISKLDTAI